MYIYTYIHIYMYVYMYVYTYIPYTHAYIHITLTSNTCKIRPGNMTSDVFDVDVGQRCVRVWDDFDSPQRVRHFEKRRQMSPPAPTHQHTGLFEGEHVLPEIFPCVRELPFLLSDVRR